MKSKPDWKFLGIFTFSNGETVTYWQGTMSDGRIEIHTGSHSPDTGRLDKKYVDMEIAWLIYTLGRDDPNGIRIAQYTKG